MFRTPEHESVFDTGRALHQRGGPLARVCGARLRTGAACTQLALSGEARCLRHCGPNAARRFRARQLGELESGSVSPAEWTRAEEKRARNALQWAWRKDPRIAGRTIDLGADEASFVASTAALGLDASRLYPALADWLRWRWRRHHKDRPNPALWIKTVRDELPKKQTAADTAVEWTMLGIKDRRSLEARAAKAAIASRDMARARLAMDAVRAASSAVVDVRTTQQRERLTQIAVRPWTGRPLVAGWKRGLPYKCNVPAAKPTVPRPKGRPRTRPNNYDDFEALGAVLLSAGPSVRAMFSGILNREDQIRFLRDLRDYACAPDDAGAQRRWMGWVTSDVCRG